MYIVFFFFLLVFILNTSSEGLTDEKFNNESLTNDQIELLLHYEKFENVKIHNGTNKVHGLEKSAGDIREGRKFLVKRKGKTSSSNFF